MNKFLLIKEKYCFCGVDGKIMLSLIPSKQIICHPSIKFTVKSIECQVPSFFIICQKNDIFLPIKVLILQKI